MADGIRGVDVVTPIATLCYSYLTSPDDKGKYRAELVFPTDMSKSDLELMGSLESASADLIKAKWPQKSKGKNPGIIRADQTSTDDALHNECLAIVRPWTRGRDGAPNIEFKKLPNLRDNLAKDEVSQLFYDGCKVRARICPFTYDVDGNAGVAWFLNALLFVEEGERIGGSGNSAGAFAAAGGYDMEEEGSVGSLL